MPDGGSNVPIHRFARCGLRAGSSWRDDAFRVGEYVRETTLGKILNFHLSKYMPRIFTGEASRSRYSIELVSFMSEYGLSGNDPELLRIN